MRSGDNEIRVAFHAKRLRIQHKCSKTLVIDELGIAHGRKRVDVAVLNGTIHGYEIKSSKDNLERLPEQLLAYTKCFEKLTIVSAPDHLDGVLNIAPSWCEIVTAEKGKRGGIHFHTVRRGRKNLDIDLVSLLHLLWKKEAYEFLSSLGDSGVSSNSTRIELYERISTLATFQDILDRIKSCFISRKNWRLDQLQK